MQLRECFLTKYTNPSANGSDIQMKVALQWAKLFVVACSRFGNTEPWLMVTVPLNFLWRFTVNLDLGDKLSPTM